MPSALSYVLLSSIALAVSGGAFGVALARYMWAGDLKLARELSDINRGTVASLSKTLEAQKQTLSWQAQTMTAQSATIVSLNNQIAAQEEIIARLKEARPETIIRMLEK